MDKDEEVVVEPQQSSSKAMDEQQGVDDPYGFIVEQCIIPCADQENQLRSMPLFSPTPSPTQQPSPPPPVVVKHEQTGDEIDIIMQQPLEMDKEKEAIEENMEVDDDDDDDEESVTKEPTISVESSPPSFQNEGFSLQSPSPTRDEPAAAAIDDDDGTTPSPVTGEGLQKTIQEESPPFPPTKTQTGQTHFVPPRVQPAATAAAAVGVGVGASSSSSSNPKEEDEEEEEDNTTMDILDVLRSKGFYVPRPRWWRPEGYDKP